MPTGYPTGKMGLSNPRGILRPSPLPPTRLREKNLFVHTLIDVDCLVKMAW